MKKISATVSDLKIFAKVLNYRRETRFGIMKVRDGGRATSTLEIFHDPRGAVLMNVSGVCTLVFDSYDEFDAYMERRFTATFDTEKEMYKAFTGMDDDTWNAWNAEEN